MGVIVVQVCEPVFRNLPHSYTWPLKKWTHSYTWSSEMLTYLYTALWFFSHLLLVVRQISQSIHWIPKEQAASKNLWWKRYTHIPGCQKSGAFRKISGQSYTFSWKKGLIIYLAALKKGAIRHAHPYYTIYMKLPPPHPLPHPTSLRVNSLPYLS